MLRKVTLEKEEAKNIEAYLTGSDWYYVYFDTTLCSFLPQHNYTYHSLNHMEVSTWQPNQSYIIIIAARTAGPGRLCPNAQLSAEHDNNDGF